MIRRSIAATLALAALSAGPWVHAARAQSLMCQADLYGTSGGPVPLTVHFRGRTAGGNLPLSFFWDFGDGNTSTQQDPVHEYQQSGLYHATLRVTPNGMPADACRDTLVVPVATFIDPICWASANKRWAETSQPIQFSAGPGFAPGPPYVWAWNFGDGATLTQQANGFVAAAHGFAVPGTYWVAVSMETSEGTYNCYPTIRVTTLVPQEQVGVEPSIAAPTLRLERPRPNPFGIATTLGYELPRAGAIHLAIFDAQGRLVATLVDDVRPAGRHIAVWQGRADAGAIVRAGVYLAVLEQDGKSASTRIVRMH